MDTGKGPTTRVRLSGGPAWRQLPAWTPGLRSAYVRNLAAFSLVVGLCVAIALAPMLQRWAWLFPMPGTRGKCPALGNYESLRTQAELANLADRDGGRESPGL